MSRADHRHPGPDGRREEPGMGEALDALDAREGPLYRDEEPRVSTFPMTAAARWAVRVWHRRGRLGIEDDQLVLLPPEEESS